MYYKTKITGFIFIIPVKLKEKLHTRSYRCAESV